MRKKNALVVGIANSESLSAGIARELHNNGYQIIATYLNDKAYPHVKAVTDTLGTGSLLFPFKVGNDAQLDEMVAQMQKKGMRLDVLLHGIAYASEIRKELHKVSWNSFRDSIRVSAFSMVELTRKMIEADILNPGSSILTLSYIGSHLAIEGYNMMGPVKSILEALVRGLASELGGKGIRVNALSPGPVMTRAASGIGGFSNLIHHVKSTTPLNRTATLEDIGKMAFEVISNPSINGAVYPVDCGSSVLVHVGQD